MGWGAEWVNFCLSWLSCVSGPVIMIWHFSIMFFIVTALLQNFEHEIDILHVELWIVWSKRHCIARCILVNWAQRRSYWNIHRILSLARLFIWEICTANWICVHFLIIIENHLIMKLNNFRFQLLEIIITKYYIKFYYG